MSTTSHKSTVEKFQHSINNIGQFHQKWWKLLQLLIWTF